MLIQNEDCLSVFPITKIKAITLIENCNKCGKFEHAHKIFCKHWVGFCGG